MDELDPATWKRSRILIQMVKKMSKQTNAGRIGASRAASEKKHALRVRRRRRVTRRGRVQRSSVNGSRLPQKTPKADSRRDYGLTLQVSFVVALLLVIGLFHLPLRADRDYEVPIVEQEVVRMEEIQQTKQHVKPPPPPRPPVPVEVPDDIVITDDELDLDATLDIGEPLADLPPPPPPPAPEEEVEPEEVEEEIFVAVEEMPEIIGGTRKIYEYLEYPEMARQAEVQGLVVVQFVVEPDGVPSHPVVLRSANALLDEAAVEAVMQLRFKPGKQRGKAVRVRFAIPIRFELRGVKAAK